MTFSTQVVIYKGICSCGETYVGETIRYCEIKWDEHNDVNKNSESAKHLATNIEHEISWYILARAPENIRQNFGSILYKINCPIP